MSIKDSECGNIIDRPDFNQPKDLFYPDWSICKTEEGFRQWLKNKPNEIIEDPINEVLNEQLNLTEEEVVELVEQYLSTDSIDKSNSCEKCKREIHKAQFLTRNDKIKKFNMKFVGVKELGLHLSLGTEVIYDLSAYRFHALAILTSNGVVGVNAHGDTLNLYGTAKLLRNGVVIETQKFEHHKGYGLVGDGVGIYIGDVFFDLPQDIISGEIIQMQIITSAEYIATGQGPSNINENIIFDLPYFIEVFYEDI